PGCEHFLVVGAKRRRLVLGENFRVGLAYGFIQRQMKYPLKLAVEMQVTAFPIFQINNRWAVVHKRPQPRFAFTQSLLCPLTLRDVANRAAYHQALRRVERTEADFDGKLCPVLAQPEQFQPTPHGSRTRVGEKIIAMTRVAL